MVGVCAAGQQGSRAFAPPHVRRPPEVLDQRWQHFPPAWHVATDVGGRPSSPGSCDQGASRLGAPGCGARTLPAALGAGRLCGAQAQICHHLAQALNAREVAAFGPDGYGHGALPPTQALQGLDYGVPSPGCDLRSPCLLQTLEAFGGLRDRADIVLEDQLVSRGAQTTAARHRTGPGP
jgi:hypothetical protein